MNKLVIIICVSLLLSGCNEPEAPPPLNLSAGWSEPERGEKLKRKLKQVGIPFSTTRYQGIEYVVWDKLYGEQISKLINVDHEETVVGTYRMFLDLGEKEKAFSLIEEHALKGVAIAQHEYALEFFTRKKFFAGTPKDEAKALIWFHKAAKQGLAKSMAQIGQSYEMGISVKPDLVEAVVWYKKAADKDEPIALWKLGKFYELGLGGLEQDLDKAESYFKQVKASGSDFSFLDSNYK